MTIRSTVSAFVWVCIHTMLMASAFAQHDNQAIIGEIDAALEKAEWTNAEEQIERMFKRYERRHDIPGVSIGALLFKKGWCELKQEKWAEAQKSFEWCYKKYPDLKKNPHHRLALRGWADAAMGSGDVATAAKIYRKYIEEASRTNWSNPFAKKPK